MAEEIKQELKSEIKEKEFRPLLRIIDKDVNGEESIWIALTRVKGIDFMMSNAICTVLELPKLQKVGYLTEAEIEKIEDCMQNPGKYGIPVWLFNRRKDLETGQDKHLAGVNVGLQQSLDIRFLRKIRNYRGVRHAKGQRVRGQRTRTTGRKGSTLGVTKKKEMPKVAPKAGEKEKK